MAAADDFKILDEAVKNGLQSVSLLDGRTFTLEQARTERDRLEKELKKKGTLTETEESIKDQQIKDAKKIVKNRESRLTQTLRAFGKNNASARDVANAQEALRTSSEFLARLTSKTAVTAPATGPATAVSATGGVNVLSRTQRGESVTPVSEEEDVPVVKTTKVVITKTQVDKKLVELNLADTPENRKVARQQLKTGTTVAPGAVDTSWEPLFKQNYPQYSWMFTDLDRTKYADVFDLFKRLPNKSTCFREEFDRQIYWYFVLS
jgi:dsDNA-specific endonuclease/ATPase MutS2